MVTILPRYQLGWHIDTWIGQTSPIFMHKTNYPIVENWDVLHEILKDWKEYVTWHQCFTKSIDVSTGLQRFVDQRQSFILL